MMIPEINARLMQAAKRVPKKSYWRHRDGSLYVVRGYSFDSEKEMVRVAYRQIDEELHDIHPIREDWSHLVQDFTRTGADGTPRFTRMERIADNENAPTEWREVS